MKRVIHSIHFLAIPLSLFAFPDESTASSAARIADVVARTDAGTGAPALARAVASPEPQADARPDAQAFHRAHAPTFAGADDRAYDGTDAAS